ncbi:NuA4-domain-containing protein [Meredithblackwellia eburnea MCA 4105]
MSETAASTSSATATPAAPAAPAEPPADPAELRRKLENNRRELRMYLDKKRKIDRDLISLEASIYAFEGSYLSDALLPATTPAAGATSQPNQFGNIIKGYESYLKSGPSAGGGDRKRGRQGEEARDNDRMFSRSSATFQKAIDMRNSLSSSLSGGPTLVSSLGTSQSVPGSAGAGPQELDNLSSDDDAGAGIDDDKDEDHIPSGVGRRGSSRPSVSRESNGGTPASAVGMRKRRRH